MQWHGSPLLCFLQSPLSFLEHHVELLAVDASALAGAAFAVAAAAAVAGGSSVIRAVVGSLLVLCFSYCLGCCTDLVCSGVLVCGLLAGMAVGQDDLQCAEHPHFVRAKQQTPAQQNEDADFV
jgi:hypothetical protein